MTFIPLKAVILGIHWLHTSDKSRGRKVQDAETQKNVTGVLYTVRALSLYFFSCFLAVHFFYSQTQNSFKDSHLTQFTFWSSTCKLHSTPHKKNVKTKRWSLEGVKLTFFLPKSGNMHYTVTPRPTCLHLHNTGAMIYRICLFCQPFALQFRHLYPLQPIPPAAASQFRDLGLFVGFEKQLICAEVQQEASACGTLPLKKNKDMKINHIRNDV